MKFLTMFNQTLGRGFKPNSYVLTTVLKSCSSFGFIWYGMQVHGLGIKILMNNDVFVATSLIGMYFKCSRLQESSKVFEDMHDKNIVTWTNMIIGYAQNYDLDNAIRVLSVMMVDTEFRPNAHMVSSIFSGCANIGLINLAKQMHGGTIKRGLQCNIIVDNSLLSMYTKCQKLEEAISFFDEMKSKDLISWSTMIVGLADHGNEEEALGYFRDMVREGFRPNEFSLSSILRAAWKISALDLGKQIHSYVVRSCLVCPMSVSNSLISMYSICSSIENARQVFDKMPARNIISWSAMLAGYVEEGYNEEALEHALEMRDSGIKGNEFTYTSMIRACSNLGFLDMGRQLHSLVIRCCFESHGPVSSSLIMLYSKCGEIKDAGSVFDISLERDLVTWTAMLVAYAMHGLGQEAIELFERMLREGIRPDNVAFVGVLSACSNSGLLKEGWKYFNCMIHDFLIQPQPEHYACMVDLLGKAGSVDEAVELIRSMPKKPDAFIWESLLGACKLNGEHEVASQALKRLIELDSKSTVKKSFQEDLKNAYKKLLVKKISG